MPTSSTTEADRSNFGWRGGFHWFGSVGGLMMDRLSRQSRWPRVKERLDTPVALSEKAGL